MTNFTVKTCEIMQYYHYMDCNEIAVIMSRIKEITGLKTFCIINHDKDLLPSGEPKPNHFHAVLTFNTAKTVQSIAKAVRVEPQFVNKIKTTTKSAQLYLVHRNNPEKYQYSPNEVFANFDYINLVDDCPAKIKRETIAERIANGEIKEYNITSFVAIDDYSRNKKYYQNCFEYRQNKIKGLDRNMKTLFITGGSGTGKSTYAKMIASQKGYTAYVSSGGKNPLDNYKGEECIILDDTRSSSWHLTDFLKLTDNNTDSLVGCRYYNKSIAECKYLIVTSVKSIDEFYENATREDNEPKIQLFRRFPMLISLTADKMVISAYNEQIQRYTPQIEAMNPVSALFNPVNAKKMCDDFATAMGLKILSKPTPTLTEVDDEMPF